MTAEVGFFSGFAPISDHLKNPRNCPHISGLRAARTAGGWPPKRACGRSAGSCDRPEAPPATPVFMLLFLPSSEKDSEWGAAFSKKGERGPNACLFRSVKGQGRRPSPKKGAQSLARPNRGRTHRETTAEREIGLSLYCISGSDMRQEPCSQFFIPDGSPDCGRRSCG